MGVVIHLFVDSAQDLPLGSHRSVGEPLQLAKDVIPKSTIPSLLSSAWTRDLTTILLQHHNITMNVWGIVNFDSQEIGLQSLHDTAVQSGGTLHRTVLGLQPAQERARLTELLRRSVISCQATRAILKMRGPNFLEFLPETVTGGIIPDPELPGVFRLSSCSPEKTVGMQFRYNSLQRLEGKQIAEVVLQMAFSYETLAETEDYLSSSVEQETNEAGVEEGEDDDEEVSLYSDSSDVGPNSSSSDESGIPSSSQRQARGARARSNRTFSGRNRASTDKSNVKSRNSKENRKNGKSGGRKEEKAFCGLLTSPDGFFEKCVDAVGLTSILAQIVRNYHVADATLACRRQAAAKPKFVSVADSFMLNQDTNRLSELSNQHKLLVVKYLRIFTVKIPCSQYALHLLACTDVAAHVSLQMRRALQLERQHRLNCRYTPESTRMYGDSNMRDRQQTSSTDSYEDVALVAFTDKINMQSPGVTLLVNSLVKRIVTITREYTKEKQERAALEDATIKAKQTKSIRVTGAGRNTTPIATPSPATIASAVATVLRDPAQVESILGEIMEYSVVKDMLIYTFAAVDKLTCFTPTVDTSNKAYVMDEGVCLESLCDSLDPVNIARVLHPLLVPVVTSAEQHFLLDAGTECLLYRSANAPASGTSSSVSSSVGKFESMLEVAPHVVSVARKDAITARKQASKSTAADQSSTISRNSESESEAVAGAITHTAPRVVNYMYDGDFLLGYLQRRICSLEVLPRVQFCDVGTASASMFAAHLLIDHTRSGLVFAQFVQFVIEVVKRDLTE
eukprot:CAMPEP_0170382846 /NCGR_PEP_ID=MMETSP0117_2-20130122/15163_1 /TAXON_ID=400756 /ORGANISM="Durinskia baltica, Strain CSIRO CS-38" /LENGTH=792 /DNA_ID=CAMNT_0010638517 /DNA_START=1 /DNA_END=2379 /DNA_ORIENTATION=-